MMGSVGTVLLIEDNAAEARLVREQLADRFGTGVALHAVPTLDTGLKWLDTQSPDLILLDLSLPDSQGLQTFHRVREHAPRTPVVILSGYDDDETALDAVRAGAADYLAKQHADGVALARTMRHAVERQRAEMALRASEARYRTIVETAEEGIVQLDETEHIRFANTRLARMLAVEPEQLQGRTFADLVDPAYRSTLDHLINASVYGRRRTGDLRLLRSGGATVWTLAAVGAIRVPDSDRYDAVIMLTDISGRMLAEQELVRIARTLERRVDERTLQLEAARRELTVIQRSLTRDVRPPLQAVAGLEGCAGHADAGVAAAPPLALQAVRRADARIGALLALHELADCDMRRDPLDLSAMAASIVDRLHHSMPQCEVDVEIEPGLRDQGDEPMVRCLLESLIDNAWRYAAPTRRPLLRFGRARGPGGRREYVVQDNGVGFDARVAAALFTPLESITSSADFSGIGVGLASARRVVERHGGTLRAESRPGEGSRFYFTLGATGAADPGAAAAPPR